MLVDYNHTDSFIVHIKTEEIYAYISKDVEAIFDISNCELDRTLPKGKNEKVIGLMKDELSGEIMKGFVALRAKTYGYLTNNNNKDKKAKDTKKCVTKKIKFEDYEYCSELTHLKNKINQSEKKNKVNIDSLKLILKS